MVAIDTRSGATIPVGGAALLSGPALVIGAARRQDETVRRAPGVRFPDVAGRRQVVDAPRPGRVSSSTAATADAQDVAPDDITLQLPGLRRQEVLPARWGVPAYFSNAPYGPPYELMPRMAEWTLSAQTSAEFRGPDRAGRMALAAHPKGGETQSSGSFLSLLYGQTPIPQYAGLSFDAYM